MSKHSFSKKTVISNILLIIILASCFFSNYYNTLDQSHRAVIIILRFALLAIAISIRPPSQFINKIFKKVVDIVIKNQNIIAHSLTFNICNTIFDLLFVAFLYSLTMAAKTNIWLTVGVCTIFIYKALLSFLVTIKQLKRDTTKSDL